MGDQRLERKDKEIIRKDLTLNSRSLIDLIEQVHKKKSDFKFKASGSSMTPCILDGDIITISPIGKNKPIPGEVVAYKNESGSELIVHRITKKSGEYYSIKGDNTTYSHHLVPAEKILGIVTSVEREGKSIFWPGRNNLNKLYKMYLSFYLFKMKLFRFVKKFLNKIFN